MAKTSIAVLIPTRGTIFTRTMMSVLREVSGKEHSFYMTEDIPLPDSRNVLVQKALESSVTHFLLVDDDIDLPVGSLDRMLDKNEPIVIIDYPTHWIGENAGNTGNVAYNYWLPRCEGECKHDPKVHEIKGKEIMWAGIGCALIKREVFETIKPQWFEVGGKMFLRKQKTGEIYYTGFVQSQGGGEDFVFYQKAKEKGYKINLIEDMVCGHGKMMKHIGVLTPGKYVSQHDLKFNYKIDRPIK